MSADEQIQIRESNHLGWDCLYGRCPLDVDRWTRALGDRAPRQEKTKSLKYKKFKFSSYEDRLGVDGLIFVRLHFLMMFHLLQRRSWCARTCWSPSTARFAPPVWSGWPPVRKISCFSLSSSLSQGHCCRHRQDIHLVFSMTSVKSCISKLGCRNDQAVWNTKKKMKNATTSTKKC